MKRTGFRGLNHWAAHRAALDWSFREMPTEIEISSPPQAELLTVDALAELLHRSPNTIRCDAHRAPARLPPILRLPQHNRLLWRRVDVDAWLSGHVTSAPPPSAAAITGRRRGRPTKVEQRARAATATGRT